MYKLHQRSEVESKFKKYFKTSFIPFYDHRLTILFYGQMKIDISQFETYLQIPDNISMKQFIIDNYGKNALNFIKQLL